MIVTGQYYTAEQLSNLLVARIQCDSVSRVLDLGVGKGTLLDAAHRRWGNAQLYGADIDPASITAVSTRFPAARLFHIDGLSTRLPQELNIKVGSIDVAVCNPPYFRVERTADVVKLLDQAGLVRSVKLPRITSDVLFLAQNLQMLKEGGELGIILPDGIFTSHEFAPLREDLLEDHGVLGVVQLPDQVFSGTEARTHILLLRKRGRSENHIPIFRSNSTGVIEHILEVPGFLLSDRMDYSFHHWRERHDFKSMSSTLADLEVDIKRGKRQRNHLRDLDVPFFHTTSFPADLHAVVDLPFGFSYEDTLAEAGDVLVARVGKRCIGRVTLVNSGRQVVTDCVYRIRSEEFGRKIWKALTSTEGQEWLKAHSHGVCARVISKKDLLRFKVDL